MNGNSSWSQFNPEVESNILSFVDVFRNIDSIQPTVFHKYFAFSVVPHIDPSHPSNQTFADLETFLYFSSNICSTSQLLSDELNHLKAIAVYRD